MDRLGGVCRVCGTSEQLTFDHIDRTTKLFSISEGIRDGYSLLKLSGELDKCQLLCRPHHLVKSRISGDLTGGGWNRIDNPEHGTAARYAIKCRCARCRDWKRLYRAGELDSRGKPRAA
ncbi:Uncharacterised protein [Mycobacteroides abscessus subsp. bolletii]|nr:Uncharacterised protein [Mycobacteroides abscessus]SKF40735.1 Uncharacterised protein [Mycobacteroides abscessus subsp. bolletii]SKH19166.1 Uncharacterised protein [Mycobacteroides abscessus subsp. bolletii]